MTFSKTPNPMEESIRWNLNPIMIEKNQPLEENGSKKWK